MASDLPKVLHPVCGKPMARWVVDACRDAGCARIVLIVGYGADQVRPQIGSDADLHYAIQEPQLGTGHAVMQARPVLKSLDPDDPVLVLNGDGPLVQADLLTRMRQTLDQLDVQGVLATAELDDPTGYGRIIRDDHDRLLQIVEEKDATDDQRQVREINPNYCCYRCGPLLDALDRLGNDNAQGEYYLTDVPQVIRDAGGSVALLPGVPPENVLGVNTPEQLAHVESIMRARAEGATAACGSASVTQRSAGTAARGRGTGSQEGVAP
jgi:bifunctional UDP-N-acetylglucosamine pyrophosphorylase/glucosamine-1-phosphate N-acetyltransferase